MGRDRQEAVMIVAMILCTAVQAGLTLWMLVGR